MKTSNKPNIIFYCSWGGLGHVARACAIIKNLPNQGAYTVATPERWPFSNPSKNFRHIKLPEPKSRIRLDKENLIVQNYTPKANDIEGYKKHLHAFIKSLRETNPQLVVVDNPAEISIITKILGYKTVVIYESLNTTDLRWRLGWKNVDKILAPYPKQFLTQSKFPYLKNTYCSGGFTRYDGEPIPDQVKAKNKISFNKNKKHVLVTVGKGRKSEKIIKKILKATSNLNYQIVILYPEKSKAISKITKQYPRCIQINNVYDKIKLYLSTADIIITGAGYNSVMESCYFRKPTIAIPLERIYNEQLNKAKIMSDLGAVEFIKPGDLDSKTIKQKISKFENKKELGRIKKSQKKIVDGQGAQRAAEMLTKLINQKPKYA